MSNGNLFNIPTEYDAEVRISVAPDTMLYITAIILVALAAKRKKLI